VKDFPRIELGGGAQEILEEFGLIKGSNGLLEVWRPKKLPPGHPAKLEAIIGGGAPPVALKAVKEGIEALKYRFDFDEEALDPEGGIRIE